jgi:hypothetical protein
MARSTKPSPNQLPLICLNCTSGPVSIIREGDHVMIRCQSCGNEVIALTLTPPTQIVLGDIEIELLRTVTPLASLLYEFIRRFQHHHGYAPSIRDMQQAMGWNSPSAVSHHLKSLEKVGLIKRDYAIPRSIRLPHAA